MDPATSAGSSRTPTAASSTSRSDGGDSRTRTRQCWSRRSTSRVAPSSRFSPRNGGAASIKGGGRSCGSRARAAATRLYRRRRARWPAPRSLRPASGSSRSREMVPVPRRSRHGSRWPPHRTRIAPRPSSTASRPTKASRWSLAHDRRGTASTRCPKMLAPSRACVRNKATACRSVADSSRRRRRRRRR